MCYHVSSNLGDEKIKSLLRKKVVLNAENYTPGFHFHGFSKPFLPVVSTLNPDALDYYRWMLIPSWVKNERALRQIH